MGPRKSTTLLPMAYNLFREAYYRFLDPCLAGKYLYLPDPLEKVPLLKGLPKKYKGFALPYQNCLQHSCSVEATRYVSTLLSF